MYLYKVYLHCQECLGTERRQLLAARSSARADLKWLPSGLLKCRRPPAARAGLRLSPGTPEKRGSHIKESGYHSFLFFFFKYCFKKLECMLECHKLESGDTGLFWNSTHLNRSVTPVPRMLSANERNSIDFVGKNEKETPDHMEIYYRNAGAKSTLAHLQWRDFDMVYIPSLSKPMCMQNDSKENILYVSFSSLKRLCFSYIIQLTY